MSDLSRFETDPVGFGRCIEAGLYARQEEVLADLACGPVTPERPIPGVQLDHCYAAGGSRLAAVATLWHTYCRPPALTVVTGWRRGVREIFWQEVKRVWYPAFRKGLLYGRLLIARLDAGPDQLAISDSAQARDQLVGNFSEFNLLVIQHDCSSADSLSAGFEVWNIVNRLPDSVFFRVGKAGFDAPKDWAHHAIDAYSTPNLTPGAPAVPGLVTADWVEDKKRRWLSDESAKPLWHRNVLAQRYEVAKV